MIILDAEDWEKKKNLIDYSMALLRIRRKKI